MGFNSGFKGLIDVFTQHHGRTYSG